MGRTTGDGATIPDGKAAGRASRRGFLGFGSVAFVVLAGQGLPQARSEWRRDRNHGQTPMRSLAVFFGEKHVPNVLHPPKVG